MSGEHEIDPNFGWNSISALPRTNRSPWIFPGNLQIGCKCLGGRP